ncbi:MAG TPA: DNA replication and repair protein RecF, partial [Malonomonas sp.]
MVIKKIKIGNFRNIESAEFKVSPKLNFFVGNNAQGKTNLVEAIYTAAFLKSFRTQNIEETIKENSSRATIEIEVNNQSVNNIINCSYDKKNKILTIDKKKPEYNKYYSLLNVVIFYPEEVNYLSNYPLFRRNLLDRSIFYSNFDYIYVYKKYVRCLKQRNSYLKKDSRDVDCWTDQLIAYGSEIVKERLLYIEKINNYFNSFNFKKINGENYYLNYS